MTTVILLVVLLAVGLGIGFYVKAHRDGVDAALEHLKSYVAAESVTWWTGVTATLAGMAEAAGLNHPALGIVGNVISTLTGGDATSPAGLIALGLGLIGIKAHLNRI